MNGSGKIQLYNVCSTTTEIFLKLNWEIAMQENADKLDLART